MKITILWDVKTWSLVDRYRHLWEAYCAYLQGRIATTLKVEAELFSEISVTIYQTKRRYNPEDIIINVHDVIYWRKKIRI
jgi:hypothetical protein